MIRRHGGIFGRNPAFQNVEINGKVQVNADAQGYPPTQIQSAIFGEPAIPQGDGTGDGGVTAPVFMYKSALDDNGEPYTNPQLNTPLSIVAYKVQIFGNDPGWVGNYMLSVVDGVSGIVNFSVLDNGQVNTPLLNADLATVNRASLNSVAINEQWLSGTSGPFVTMYGDTNDPGTILLLRDVAQDTDFDGIPEPVLWMGDGGDVVTSGGITCSSLGFGRVANNVNYNSQTIAQSVWQQAKATRTSTATFTAAQWATTLYGGVKVIVQGRNATAGRFDLAEYNVIYDGVTTVIAGTVSSIATGGSNATYAFDVSGAYIRLRITPLLSSSTVFIITSLALTKE